MRVRLAHYLWVVDLYLWELEGEWGESHGHAMVFVGVDRGKACLAGFAIPIEGVVVLVVDDIAHLLQLGLERLDAVGLLNFQEIASRPYIDLTPRAQHATTMV